MRQEFERGKLDSSIESLHLFDPSGNTPPSTPPVTSLTTNGHSVSSTPADGCDSDCPAVDDEESSTQCDATEACEGGSPDLRYRVSHAVSSCRFFGSEDIAFSRIHSDLDTIVPGDLVVYRIGEVCPSRLVASALARGAAGILTEQVLPSPVAQCIVPDVEHASAQLRSHQLGRPDRKLLSIGVVGSSGKTSTALMVANLLRGCGHRTAYQCDLGQSDGIVQETPSEPVPDGASLVQWIADAVDGGSAAAVIELTDEGARQGRYETMQFDLIVVTGGDTSDEDFGPTAVQCVLESLADGGVVIASADDTKTVRLIRDTGARLLTYGVRKAADVTAKIIEQSGGMTTLLMTHRETTAVMETPLVGPAMAANHAAAAVVGLLLNHPLETIVGHLSKLRDLPGRGQRLSSWENATVVIDHAGSPDRMATTLRTLRSMKDGGRLWCVLAIDPSDDGSALADYGHIMERWADESIVTAQRERKSQFLSASHHVLDGVQKCAAFRLVADRRRAIEWAVQEADPNDTVLLVTSDASASAYHHRQDLDTIAKWVETAREADTAMEQTHSCEHPNSTASDHTGPDDDQDRPTLKIFG